MRALTLATLLLSAPALASAPQRSPDPPQTYGCPVILPDVMDRDARPETLMVRTLRPLSECDDSAPVSFGASVRDSGIGRAR